MTTKSRSKKCHHCGVDFFEKARESNKQWEAREYCSMKCNNSSRNRVTCIFDRLEKYQIKEDGCWRWSGTKDAAGYGVLSNRNGRGGSPEKAHRISYEKEYGEMPSELVVRHKCDNPECTNPEHLELGTQKDNSRDMVDRGRMNPKSLENLNHDRKLTQEQISEIEQIQFVGINGRGAGRTRKDVAAEYGVCVDLIYRIVRNKEKNNV